MSNKVPEKQHTLWLPAAMAAPLTQAASNCSWPVAAVVGMLSMGICAGVEKLEENVKPGRWSCAIRWLWLLLVMSEFMHWTNHCWPGRGSEYAVPLIVLALAAYAVGKGQEKASRAGALILWLLVFLLGAVLLSAAKEVNYENLEPVWKIQTAHIVTVMLIPTMGLTLGRTKNKAVIPVYAILVSIITTGVMSLKWIQHLEVPFYEMSRSLTLLGIAERVESLVASGMTLGYFVLMSYLVSIAANAWETGMRHRRSVWISALFTALVYMSGMRLNSRLLALGTIAIWVVLPLMNNILKIMKNLLTNKR